MNLPDLQVVPQFSWGVFLTPLNFYYDKKRGKSLEDRLRVGVITSTHGLKGEVKVYPTTDDLNRFKNLKKCYLCSENKNIPAQCISSKTVKNMVVLKFDIINSIEEAEKFRNFDILVDREDAVQLEEGEFFICDVIGATVYDQDNNVAGIIEEVLETAANDVFVIKNEKKEPLYVPVVPSWVDEIDTENKIVRAHLYEVAED